MSNIEQLRFKGLNQELQMEIGLIVGTEKKGKVFIQGDDVVGCQASPQTISEIRMILESRGIRYERTR